MIHFALTLGLLMLAQPAAPAESPPVAAGFKDHIVSVQGGRIDWTNGRILVDGLGRARSGTVQQRLMATRAAEIVAARNAVALARGIRIDEYGRIQSVRNGEVYVEGVIRGHRTVKSEWLPDARPPEARVTLEVPLWGIDGVASLFWRTRQVQFRYGRQRIPLGGRAAESVHTVVVFDARGLAISECLFPSIVDEDGRVLYDLATLPPATARSRPPVRYVEEQPASTTSQPVSSPDGFVRLIKVKAVKDGGAGLVVAASDARGLADGPEAATALRAGRVLILVDPSAD